MGFVYPKVEEVTTENPVKGNEKPPPYISQKIDTKSANIDTVALPYDSAGDWCSDNRGWNVEWTIGRESRDSSYYAENKRLGRFTNFSQTILTWNVRGLLEIRKLNIVKMDLKRYGIMIGGVSKPTTENRVTS